MVEAERDRDGDYGCEVEDEDSDAEDDRYAAAAGGNVEVRGRSGHLVFHCLLERFQGKIMSVRYIVAFIYVVQALEEAFSPWLCESLTPHSQRGNAM